MLKRPVWKVPVPVKQQERYVYSELEFRRAIGEVAVGMKLNSNGVYPVAFGGSIVIGAPIVFSRPVVIPFECLGLVVRSAARFPIFANGIVSHLFEVEAQMVTIRDLLVAYHLSPTSYFGTFCKTVQHANGGGKNLLLANNILNVDRVYVDETAGQADEVVLDGNQQVAEANTTHDPSVYIDSSRCEIRGGFYQDGGGDTVQVGANGGQCFIGTGLSLGGVTTTASAGENVVSGCRRTGTLTLHATDSSGLNT